MRLGGANEEGGSAGRTRKEALRGERGRKLGGATKEGGSAGPTRKVAHARDASSLTKDDGSAAARLLEKEL
jgi:hypothetical protein